LVEETSVRTRRDVLATAGLAFIAGARRARAQDGYPERPIRILVGYPAGGGVDIVARLRSGRSASSSAIPRAAGWTSWRGSSPSR